MKRTIQILALILILGSSSFAQTIESFSLPSTSGADVSLSEFSSAKGVVVVFSGDHCIYSKKYEKRLISLANEFKRQGIEFVMVNSNDPELSEDESMESMKARAEAHNYPFPYLQDKDKTVANQFGATKNPEVFLLHPVADAFKVVYTGKIDDNPLMEQNVSKTFLKDAINKLLSGDTSDQGKMEVVGCNIH